MAESSAGNVIWAVLDGEAVLLDTTSGDYYSLNETATEVWKELQQGRSPEQAAASIAAKYGIALANARADVAELLDELRAIHALP